MKLKTVIAILLNLPKAAKVIIKPKTSEERRIYRAERGVARHLGGNIDSGLTDFFASVLQGCGNCNNRQQCIKNFNLLLGADADTFIDASLHLYKWCVKNREIEEIIKTSTVISIPYKILYKVCGNCKYNRQCVADVVQKEGITPKKMFLVIAAILGRCTNREIKEILKDG